MDPRTIQPGAMLGRYRLVQRIARGGMGEVWLANASGSGGFTKRVVVKTILPERAADPAFVEMLAREARMCGELNHPNLIEVFDFSEHEGTYAIAMEYVIGRSLSQIIRASGVASQPIPVWCALRLIWEACRGLECAHGHGIIHCDLSPGNIMLSFGGVTKVLDFGVAQSHACGLKADRLKGKYHYMAPERVTSLVTDRRTDVYALGVILYVLLTGRLPITALTDEALLLALVHEKPQPPGRYRKLDPEVEQVILCAMEHDPGRRYQDVSSMLHAITRCREGQPAACSQLDMAMYVGALFPDAPELPEYVRSALHPSPERIDAEETQRRQSPFVDTSADLDEFDSFSIDVGDDPDAPPLTGPAQPLAVRRLFDSAGLPRRVEANLFAGAALAAGSHSLTELEPAPSEASGVFGEVPEAGETSRGVFGDRPRNEAAPWPWSVSVIKQS